MRARPASSLWIWSAAISASACGFRKPSRSHTDTGFESVAPDAGYLKSLSENQLSELRADLTTKKLVWERPALPSTSAAQSRRSRMACAACRVMPRRSSALASRAWAPGSRRATISLTYLSNFKQHTSRLREIAKVLGDHGIRLGLEYVGPKTSWSATRYPFIHTMAEMRELIAAIDQPNVGLLLDSWHWYTAHETEADLLSLKGAEVVACDLNDAPAGIPIDEQKDNTRDLPCATGVIDLKAFLGALVKIGYDGPVRAEPFKADLRRLSAEEAVDRTAKAMKRAIELLT